MLTAIHELLSTCPGQVKTETEQVVFLVSCPKREEIPTIPTMYLEEDCLAFSVYEHQD